MEENLEKIPATPVPTKQEQDKDYWGDVPKEVQTDVDQRIQERIKEQIEELEESGLDDNPPPPGGRAD